MVSIDHRRPAFLGRLLHGRALGVHEDLANVVGGGVALRARRHGPLEHLARDDELRRVLLDVVAVEHGDRLDRAEVDEHAEREIRGQAPEPGRACAAALDERYAHVLWALLGRDGRDVVCAKQADRSSSPHS